MCIRDSDEILRICRCAADLGIRKIKLTGGEPLVRKGCASLAKQIKAIPGIEKVTLTTNGILLAEQLDALLDAGIDAINISLDTLDPELFKKVARRDGLEKVFEGIEAALAHPGLSLKINSVPVIKEKENFIGIAGLAQKYPIHVRFIEMMPIGFGKQFPFQDEESIKAVLELSLIHILDKELIALSETACGDVPAYYKLEGTELVTEGFLTIEHLLEYCEEWMEDRLSFNRLKRKKDAAALLGVMLFEQATDINFYFGGAVNKSNVELGITEKRKEQVAEELVEHLQNAGKNVNIAFWAI